jgi:HAD superfamily hydrolase (TIGR01662 family)
MRKIKVVFFDFGSTLIYPKADWPPLYRQADQALVQVLRQANLPLEVSAIAGKFATFLDSYYALRSGSTIEKTTPTALRELLAGLGYPDVPVPVVRTALDAMYAITQQNWYLEADAIPTLKTLLDLGYRLGMISNTSDDKNVQQLLDREGLRPYFETILTSAGCGIRKPDARIFQLGLDHFGIAPEQAAMVGDLLETDILGANQAGIYSIWITRRVQIPEEGELGIQPQAAIGALDQIPDLLTQIEAEDT